MILGGAYDETVGRRVFECGPGRILFKPAGSEHSNVYGHRGSRALHLEFGNSRDASIEAWLQDVALPRDPVLLEGARAKFLATRLALEARQEDDPSRLAMDGLAMELLAEILRGADGSSRVAPHDCSWLDRITDMLRSDWARPHRLGTLAHEAGVSPQRLARAFRHRHACSIGEYLRRVRMNEAARALRDTPRTVAEIALEVGYYDQSHFTRTFAREIGTTPAEYRRLHRDAL